MKKIIVIGCPGSGKSTLTFKLRDIFRYPVLHLDRIYHIDNDNHISREELVNKVDEFAKSNENFIIDGNYFSTLEQRFELADTIILLDIDTQVCINNAINRTKLKRREDIAEGFDNSKINPEFLDYIKKFKNEKFPHIMELCENYRGKKQLIILNNYSQIDEFLIDLKEGKYN